VAEHSHDQAGLIWPLAIAPFQATVICVNSQEPEQTAVAEEIYQQLKRLGIDCLLDDRDERAGGKFKNAELIGVHYRITVGNKAKSGLVEVTERATKSSRDVSLAAAAIELQAMMQACHGKELSLVGDKNIC